MGKMRADVAAEWLPAKTAGLTQYMSAIPCAHGHVGLRFTLDRKCCTCNAIKCRQRHLRRIGPAGIEARQEQAKRLAERKKAKAETSEMYAEAQRARRAAIESGDTTYAAVRPCPKGHLSERYLNGGCVECAKAHVRARSKAGYYAERYAANAEDFRERARQRPLTAEMVVKRNAQASAWNANNPDKRKAIIRQYKARRRCQEASGVTGGMLAQWTRAMPKVCFYCNAGCEGTFHVDHFMPLARGGAHVLTNLRIACAPCNQRKCAKDPAEWIENLAA